MVNAKNNKVEEVKYVYAIATKKEGDAASDGAPDTRITSPSNIKIADFLEFVKRYFPNELSKDVAEQMNYERGASDIDGLKYSLYPQTMYASIKNRRPTPAIAVQAAINTSKTARKTSPISSITQNTENATDKKFSLDKDGNRVIREMPADIEEQISKYSYEELIRLPDMEVKTVEGSGLQQISYSPELKRTEIYRVAHENIKTFNNGESDNVLYNRYIGNVNIGNDGLKHSFRRVTNSDSTNRNISTAINLPLYFQNAIVINEAEGYRKSSDQAYVLIGTYRESDEQYFVRIVVNAKNNEIEEVKYVYAIATKKEGDAASDDAPDTRITSPSNIKIADFLEFVKKYFPNELSKDVAEQMNYERGASDIDGLKFSLDKDGNRVIREMPADIEEQISKNIELVRNMDPVCTVSDTVFQKGEKKLSEQVLAFFNEMGNNAFNEVIGDVALVKSGVDDDISHGMGRLKAITFRAVPDVISKGKIVDYRTQWKGRTYDTVVIAAPTIVGGESEYSGEYITAAIVIREEKGNNQRFYVHESVSIKKNELLFKTETSKNGSTLGNSSSSIFSLLQKLVNGKENVEDEAKRYSLSTENATDKKFSLDKDGNRVIREMPADIEEQISKNIELVRNMDPVCTVSDTVFQKGEKKLSEQVLDFFNEMGNNAFNEVIGDVALSKSGIDSDISHGMGRLKAITFKTVPDVISDGLIVDYKKNWKGRSYDTVVIVAPTKVEGDGKYAGEYVTAVIVMRNSYESNQRFYLHETISIKKDDLLFKTEGPQKGIVLGNSPSSIFNLLQKLVKGKENVEKGRVNLLSENIEQNNPMAL